MGRIIAYLTGGVLVGLVIIPDVNRTVCKEVVIDWYTGNGRLYRVLAAELTVWVLPVVLLVTVSVLGSSTVDCHLTMLPSVETLEQPALISVPSTVSVQLSSVLPSSKRITTN